MCDLSDGSQCWHSSAEDQGLALSTGFSAEQPCPKKHGPEIDVSDELINDLANCHQQCAGTL